MPSGPSVRNSSAFPGAVRRDSREVPYHIKPVFLDLLLPIEKLGGNLPWNFPETSFGTLGYLNLINHTDVERTLF
jgi:hypothetical protein